MTQEQALNVIKKYVGDQWNDVDSFTSYPIKATFPDVPISVRVDYRFINGGQIWGIVFCTSTYDRWGESDSNDICFCDTEEKADVVYGTIKYRG